MAEANPELTSIRIFVAGGEYGDMKYGITFIEETAQYDSTLIDSGFKLVVDPIALNYLRGCQNDFIESSFAFKSVFQNIGGSGF